MNHDPIQNSEEWNLNIMGTEVQIPASWENRGIGAERSLIDLFQYLLTASELVSHKISLRDDLPRAIRGDFDEATTQEVRHSFEKANAFSKLNAQSPFEGNPRIAGDMWRGKELIDSSRKDGIIELQFGQGVQDLPLHVHEHSDRFLVVLSGEGEFHFSPQSMADFDGSSITSVKVATGHFIGFPSGTVHTFSAPDHELVLMSYHSTFFEFEDPRQYTLPKKLLLPGSYRQGSLENADGPFG